MEDIVTSPITVTSKLTKKDVIVIWGGTRDTGRNEMNKALHQIKHSVQTHNQTNTVVMSAPTRYDLDLKLCVNDEVKVYNRKLRKHLKVFNNTYVVEVDSNRDFFTRHRLHMNLKGKEQIAKKTVLTIKDMLKQKKSDPIIMVDKTHRDAEGKMYEDETTTSIYESKVHDDNQTITFKTTSIYIYIYNFSQSTTILLVYILFITYNIQAISFGFMPSSGPL